MKHEAFTTISEIAFTFQQVLPVVINEVRWVSCFKNSYQLECLYTYKPNQHPVHPTQDICSILISL